MTTPGQPDIADLLRGHGKEAIYRIAADAGLKRVGDRIQCPFPGVCAGKGAERSANVRVFAADGGKYKLHCHVCDFSGDLLDLLQAVHGWPKAEAIAHLRGVPVPVRKLQLVPAVAPADDADKLKPAEVLRVWKTLEEDDELGRSYLEGRLLGGSSLVRYATEKSDKAFLGYAKRGRRIGMLLTDVVGNARGIQLRLARPAQQGEDKQMSLKGSAMKGAFFGQPELIESTHQVLVAEGMCDTLALQLWAPPGSVVVGAPGIGNLPALAESLRAAAIPLDGKLFVLFTQNDVPLNKSRKFFVRLQQLLTSAGAHVVICNTPAKHEDLADWRKAEPSVAWPPAELATTGDAEPGDDQVRMVTAAGSAVHLPSEIRAERFAQNFSTLCTLLDDSVTRGLVMGPGELVLSEMTEAPLFNGKELNRQDLIAIRLGLEREGRTPDGKPLKFPLAEVEQALLLLASRRRMHPVADWLKSLKWDRVDRISQALPKALSQPLDGLEAHLLRKWMIAAVARPLKPGCKMDTVLVLIGKQGVGKSRFFDALGGAFFTDEKVNVDEKDGKILMRKAWIIEWAELDSMRRARDQEAIKAFLSQRVDEFRPPYDVSTIKAPRSCVIVGTTNNEEFLSDVTGSRRFWPLTVTKIDVAWVQREREQLLAQAVQLFNAGEQWWLEDDYAALLEERNAHHQVTDDWAQLIADWAPIANDLKHEVTSAEILSSVLKKPEQHWTPQDRKRVGEVMISLGWERGTKRINGRPQPIYRKPLEHSP